MPRVIIRQAEYNYSTLKPVFYEIMDAAGGDRIQPGSRVVIKPNLLAPASPEKAIVTHPLIVRAAVEYILDKGAMPQVSDSPAVGSFAKILKESGIRNTLEGLDVDVNEFKEFVSVDVGKPFERIEIAADAVNADFFINLPKLKTHSQMLLTLGIKNLFGCIVGMKKPEWHLRTGVDRERFAHLLVKIYRAVRPDITIIDGILAMEGQGPGKSGEPREIGLVIGSSDTTALDRVISGMLGVEPDSVLTNRLAVEENPACGDIVIDGDMPEIHNFKLPEITPVLFGPERLHGFIRRHLTQRPECDGKKCVLCGECWKYCPAEAIKESGRKVRFDYDKCIRCYCCIEVCPQGALHAKETLTGRISRKILRM